MSVRVIPSVLVLVGWSAVSTLGAETADVLMQENTSQHEPTVLRESRGHDADGTLRDLRIGGGYYARPNVYERVTTASGSTAEYAWKGGNDTGYAFSVGYVTTPLTHTGSWGDPVLGGEVAYQTAVITPKRYRVGDAYVDNLAPRQVLQWQTITGNLMLGWATPRHRTAVGTMHVELVGFGGGGIGWGDTQAFGASGNIERRRGAGWQYEYGPRLGAYVCDGGWIFGVHGDWVFSHGETKIKLAQGAHSHLDLDRHSFGAEAQVGYRF